MPPRPAPIARCGCLAVVLALPAVTWAHQPPQRFPRLRPTVEATSWMGLGAGALVVDGASTTVFDLRLGGDATFAIGREGDTRLGPFVEAATATFASVQAVGGLELFVGAVPRPLRMFYYPGEGVFTARGGVGWAWREHDALDARSTPIAALTLTYGYRAPFALREAAEQWESEPEVRSTLRYMTGTRLWLGAAVDLNASTAWQLTGGIEFEPVGTFRYLLGLY